MADDEIPQYFSLTPISSYDHNASEPKGSRYIDFEINGIRSPVGGLRIRKRLPISPDFDAERLGKLLVQGYTHLLNQGFGKLSQERRESIRGVEDLQVLIDEVFAHERGIIVASKPARANPSRK